MHKDQLVRMLSDYGRRIDAHVMTDTQVNSVQRNAAGFNVATSRGTWLARAVVLATGACDTPNVPTFAKDISPRIHQVTLDRYKTPSQIAKGAVLVVGASASGVQIASELQHAGHDVALAVGQHSRIPRRYRGQDIMYWLDRTGILTQSRDPHADVDRLARQHSLQLVASAQGRSLDLETIQKQGGQITGRLIGIDGNFAAFDDTLETDIAKADARLARLLREIDEHITRSGHRAEPAAPIQPIVARGTPARLDLRASGIKTIVWAAGYKRDYSWLDIPVLSDRGEIVQQGGITPVVRSLHHGPAGDAPPELHFHRWRGAGCPRDHPTYRSPPGASRPASRLRCPMQHDPCFSKRYDAVIIGARCAGAATAMLLARQGARVLLVDWASPGTETISTHALMRGAVMQLSRWGVLPQVKASGAPAIRQTTFHYGQNVIRLPIKASHGVDALYGPRRSSLDSALVAAAWDAGVTVRFGVSFRDVIRDESGRVTGAVLADRHKRPLQVHADIVIGVDGRRSTLARRVHAPIEKMARNTTACVFGYIRDLPDTGTHWHYAPGIGTGVIPTNDDMHCVFARRNTQTISERAAGHAKRDRSCRLFRRDKRGMWCASRQFHASGAADGFCRSARICPPFMGTRLGLWLAMPDTSRIR